MSQLESDRSQGFALHQTKAFVPIFAITITAVVTSIFILIARANPIEVFYHMLIGPFTRRLYILEVMAETTPLIFTGLTVVVAFTTGYFNIGGEGQLYAGALAATYATLALANLPPLILISIAVFMGFVAGGAWSAISAILKIKFGNDEVVTTILMNVVMILFVTALLNGSLRDPNYHAAQSPLISPNAYYPLLAARSRLHFGLVVALIFTVLVAFLLNRSVIGFEMRTTGENPNAARYAGISVAKITLLAAILSGGLAGIAGVGEVLGTHHRLIATLSPGYGFTGIVVAKLGVLNPWGTIVAAILMAVLDVGAQATNLETGVPIQLAGIVRWTLLLTTLAGLSLSRYGIRRK